MAKKPETFFDVDYAKLMGEFKFPAFDVDAVMAAHRRNIEVLSQANKLALEGAQAIARRNFEIMQGAMAEAGEALRALTTNEAPQAKAARQAELLKVSYEKAVANLKEIADMIQKANAETVGLLQKRVGEALDEVKVMVEKASASMPKAA